MAGWLECATFSLDVYRGQDRPSMPEGWKLLFDCPKEFQKNNYFGAVYVKEIIKGYYDVVIAHRGTEPSNWQDIWRDIEMWFMEEPPKRFINATIPFIDDTISKLNQLFGQSNFDITFTGHSLGANLAELSLAKYFNPMTTVSGAITFESPGSKPLIQKMISQDVIPKNGLENANQYVLTANADINAINSCFEHVGSGFDSGPTNVGYTILKDPNYGFPLSPNEWYFFWDFTVNDQHSMLKMYNYWNINSASKKQLSSTHFNWPVGVKEAFKYYLNYYPEPPWGTEHGGYWDKYILSCWNAHAEIHQYYNNKEVNFATDFIKNVLRHDYDSQVRLQRYQQPVIQFPLHYYGLFANVGNLPYEFPLIDYPNSSINDPILALEDEGNDEYSCVSICNIM